MQASRIKGIITPNITTFKADGEFYDEGMRTLLELLVEKGVHGFFVNGSYGSGPLMNSSMRKKVAEIVLDELKGQVKATIMVGTASTDESIGLSNHAEDIGADAISSVVPYYYSSFMYDDDIVVNHFKHLINTVDIPVHFYNNPKTTGFSASPSLLGKLVDIGVTGMKDSSGNIILLTDFLSELERRGQAFDYIVGTSSLLLPAYMLGVKACISGVSNAFPELIVALFDVLEDGNYKKAQELQRLVNKIRNWLQISRCKPAACFAVLKMRGYEVGTVKRPWRTLTSDEYSRLKEGLETLGAFEKTKQLKK